MAIMYFYVFLLFSLTFHGHGRANSAMFRSSEVSNMVASKQYFCSFRYSVHIPKYTGKYLFRRISHASNGSYNHFIITNKQGNIIHTLLKKNKMDFHSQSRHQILNQVVLSTLTYLIPEDILRTIVWTRLLSLSWYYILCYSISLVQQMFCHLFQNLCN